MPTINSLNDFDETSGFVSVGVAHLVRVELSRKKEIRCCVPTYTIDEILQRRMC